MDVLRMAPVDRPVNTLIAGRWSPLAFSQSPVNRAAVGRLFEAARWAPSSYNEQPWRYFFATRDDAAGFERLASCLVEANSWARQAYLLGVSVATLRFARNGRPNLHAWHDLGAASQNMFLQAYDLGLYMHQMAGFDRQRARALLGLDADHEPAAMFAVGHPGEDASLPERARERQSAPRVRRRVEEFVFEGEWGRPARLP